MWSEITHLLEESRVLRHPFHERWSAGELADTDLQAYAGEHHHAVVAHAHASRQAAALADGVLSKELTLRADDREHQIELWCEFAVAAGWCPSSSWYYAEDPLPQTVACARAWSGREDRSLARHLVTLHAIESMQSEVVRLQLDALVDRYGFHGRRATRYFRDR